jgi:hypothetical protein
MRGENVSGGNSPPGKSSNILWRILGNDTHNHNDGLNLHSHGHHQRRIPSQFSIWLSALQHMRLSKALEGIHVSNNAGLLILFLGFGVWLFVVYHVRHHDPLSAVIAPGTTTPAHKILSPHRQIDEQVVSHMSGALPLKVYTDTAHIFVPGSNTEVGVSEENGMQVNTADPSSQQGMDNGYMGSTGPGAAHGAESGPFTDPRFGSPLVRTGNAQINPVNTPSYPATSYRDGPFYSAPMPQPMPELNAPLAPAAQAQGSIAFRPSHDGTRMKMCVNR